MVRNSNSDSLWKRESKFLRVISEMECRGVLTDQKKARREIAIGEAEMYRLHEKIGELSPRSSKEMHKLLIERLGLPVLKRTPAGRPSFDKKAMEEYDEILSAREDEFGDVAKDILAYRGWDKSITAFFKPWSEFVSPDGRLRTHYRADRVKTGRLSSYEPNLQQIPKTAKDATKPWRKNTKKIFIAKPGYVLINVDYSQLEFRLGSAYAQQENLLDAFNSMRATGKKRDVFTEMSLALSRDRQDCKTLTYAKMYGAKEGKIHLLLGGNPSDAVQFYRDWENEYSELVVLAERAANIAAARGYIKYWTGRRRHFQGTYEARHLAFNSLIQGGGAEVVKSAMIRLFEEVDNPDCLMLLQVHDSVLFEIKESKVDYYIPIIQELMEAVDREKDFGVHFATEWEPWG